jgi:hypothetical protein
VRQRPRLPAWLIVLLAACGSPNLPSGVIECGPGGSCPRDMTCGVDGLCGEGGGGGGPADADPDGDATASACPGGRLADLTDDFDDLAAWRVVGGELETCQVQAVGGVLAIITGEPGTCGVESAELYEFIDQSAAIRIADDSINQGNPDLVFRAVIASGTVELVWFDGAMSARSCPDTAGCSTAGISGDIRDWWRLRHDSIESVVFAELSSTGAAYPDGPSFEVTDEDATCVRLFIGSNGQLSGEDPMLQIRIDRLNIP